MNIWGINSQNHDSSLSILKNDELVFASHSERYSRIKNDYNISTNMIESAIEKYGRPDQIIWSEKPFIKTLRRISSGRFDKLRYNPYDSISLDDVKIKCVGHHYSHACAGYFTSNFKDATVIVIDAIGEFDTTTIWECKESSVTKKFSLKYPHSMGLFYSAFTNYVGLKANEEEYILMGMSAYGLPKHKTIIKETFFNYIKTPFFKCSVNLQKGCKWWENLDVEKEKFNIASSVQSIYEDYLLGIVEYARNNFKSNNLILMGGNALNCVANSKVIQKKLYDNVWIFPNPGDAGNSLGAVLGHTKTHIDFNSPFLGENIEGSLDIESIVSDLKKGDIVGVAKGKAEFGPRALGNRSLLGDPRLKDIKDRMNVVKKREKFRPFAPAILEEEAHKYFDMNGVEKSPYMQYVVKCKDPIKFPGISHVDGTSRIQTVNKDMYPDFYKLLKSWYKKTGCPMLVNTSLNIKGQPLVNTEYDARDFEKTYGIKVY